MFKFMSKPKKAMVYTVLVLATIWMLIPFLWTLENAFKPSIKLFEPGAAIPFLQYQPTLEHWNFALFHQSVIKGLINSIVVSLGTTGIVLIIGTMAGYALARYRFSYVKNKDLTIFFLSQRVLPPVVVLIPFFIILMRINLVDTRLGLILVNVTFNLPFGILIMRSIFNEIPVAIEESAFVDGANDYQVFWRIALPLAKNGLLATALIVFAFSWNEALFALTLTGAKAQTLPVMILSARSTRGVRFGFAAVNTILAIGPPIILTIFLQSNLARGLTFGALKE